MHAEPVIGHGDTVSGADDIAVGQVLSDRYEIRRVLGSGGEGVVVEAVDTRHNRRVAVKVRTVGDEGPRESLLNEARTLLSLSPHPALPTVREDVIVGNQYLLVMDWVDGIDLEKVLADGPMRPGRAMVLLGQVASALDHLHNHGLFHGDVKPANILQLPGGRAQLVDFGMAAVSLSAGSPGFAAPERETVTTASVAGDVFGFAATAVALLSGSPPIANSVGAAAATVPEFLPTSMRKALTTGLLRDPAARPPSAGALLRAMQEASPASMDDTPPTFLMTDIVGSTRKWEEQPTPMAAAVAAHDRRIQAVVSGHGGTLLHSKGEGDSTVSQFADVADALEAAAEVQHALTDWDEGAALRLAVRASVHCGPVEERDGQVYGPTLNQGARLRTAGHGGQVLVSEAVVRLLGARLADDLSLVPLGTHRIKDLSRAEPVYQLSGRSLMQSFPPLKTLERLTNLPYLSDEIVGREQDLVTVAELLTTTRVLTLTGPGGSGKTRLALQVAAEALGRFSGGVWVASLVSVAESAGVPRTVLEAIGVSGVTADPVAQIAEALRGESTLLVLDNCEHLLETVAPMVDQIVRTVPGATVVVTSRERLRIEAEVTYPVPVLRLPDDGQDALNSPAVQLFVRRATQARPGFSVSGPNGARKLTAIAEICKHLDGIPLAIELAASRVSAIPPERLAASLADRFRLASGGSRSAPARHQSLHAAVEWSESLLPPLARTTWLRVSVFRGGFTYDAASAIVCGTDLPTDDLSPVDEFELQEALTTLVDASILSVDDDGRYGLLETLREFGLERLAESGDEHAVRLRHLHWLDQLTNGGLAGLVDWASSRQALDSMLAEHTNLISSLTWALDYEPVLGARLTLHSWLHFYIRTRWAEARPYLDRALIHLEELTESEQAGLMLCAGHVLAYGGDPERAIPLITTGLERARAVGEPILEWIGMVITGAGIRAATGDIETFIACMARAVEIADEIGAGWLQAASRLWSSWELLDAKGDEYALWAGAWAKENGDDFLRGQFETTYGYFDPSHAERKRRLEECLRRERATSTYGLWTEGLLAEECMSDAEYPRAIELLKKSIRTNSGSHAGAMNQHWCLLATCHARIGELAEAEEAWAQSRRWDTAWKWEAYEAMAALALGRPDDARKGLLDNMQRLQVNVEYVDLPWWPVRVRFVFGMVAHYLQLVGREPELAGELISAALGQADGWDMDGIQRVAALLSHAGVHIPALPTHSLPEQLELAIEALQPPLDAVSVESSTAGSGDQLPV